MTVRKPPAEDALPDHLARWLEAASKRLYADIRAQGALVFPELRGSHRRILQMIPPRGVRITDLARIAGMTKQALGEFVDWLEQSGFVRSGRDPADGRVRLVTRTDRGDAAAEAASLAIAAVEREWRKEVGAAAFDTMKQALRQLGRDSFRPTS
ncbi:MAG: MarR family winged helix-turn-helix transcriptional regulator [Streptosporangiaceae bacterium]